MPAPRQLQLLHPRGLRARTDGLHYRPRIKEERNDTEIQSRYPSLPVPVLAERLLVGRNKQASILKLFVEFLDH